MRFISLAFLVVLCSCQKDQNLLSVETSVVVANDLLLPLPYHSSSFITDYPANETTPPFQFIKTFYNDTRVRTMQMTSRGNVNYPQVVGPGFSYNFDYSFTYGSGKSYITRKFKKAKESSFSSPERYECTFNENGHCTSIKYIGTLPTEYPYRIILDYDGKKLKKIVIPFVQDYAGEPNDPSFFGELDVKTDANGNVLSIMPIYSVIMNGPAPSVSYTYNLNKKGNYCYQPTQYLFSQWFAMLEVMQWIPMQVNERTAVNLYVKIDDFSNGTGDIITHRIRQGQKYSNHQYDVNNNLISYTYGDGVPQKIAWK